MIVDIKVKQDMSYTTQDLIIFAGASFETVTNEIDRGYLLVQDEENDKDMFNHPQE